MDDKITYTKTDGRPVLVVSQDTPDSPKSQYQYNMGGFLPRGKGNKANASKSAREIGDPVYALRKKMWAEYERCCADMQMKHNSGIRWALYPREEGYLDQFAAEKQKPKEVKQIKRAVCACGNVFVVDAVFCRKCGRNRGLIPQASNDGVGATMCSCGNVFAPDAIFCRKCGRKRPTTDLKVDKKEDDRVNTRSMHEYNFSRLYLGDKQLDPLSSALAFDRQLVAVMLPGCGMKDAGMVKLSEHLRRSPTLEFVDISDNRFSFEGAEACLKLVVGALRLVLVKTTDTCLDEDFCSRRGLDGKYTGVRHQVQDVLTMRALSL